MEKPDIGDYYHDLDLAETATVAQITRAFRSLALIWHPDKNIGNEEQVKPEFVKVRTFFVTREPAQVSIDPKLLTRHPDFHRR